MVNIKTRHLFQDLVVLLLVKTVYQLLGFVIKYLTSLCSITITLVK